MENKLPRISIVIPSYNKGKYIKKTLSSIFDQKYPNLEVIIQDGGSTDKTEKIVHEFINKYPKQLYFVSKKDAGQTDAINKGLKKTKGKIVTYINADDYYINNCLWKVADHFMTNPKSLWVAGFGKAVQDSGTETAKVVTLYKTILQHFRFRNFLLMVNYLYQPSVFYKRSFLRKMGEFVEVDGIVLEYDMWLKMAEEAMHDNIPYTISAFRFAKGGFSTSQTEKILNAELEIVKKHTRDPILLFLHKFNHVGRGWMQKLFKL